MDERLSIRPANFATANVVDINVTGLFLPSDPSADHELFFGHDSDGAPKAFIVSEDRKFGLVDPKRMRRSNGIFIPDASTEILPRTAYDAEHLYSPYGALVRSDDKLLVMARGIDGYGFGEVAQIVLATDLPILSAGVRTGFYEWRIVLGTGAEKQVVKSFQLEPANGPPR